MNEALSGSASSPARDGRRAGSLGRESSGADAEVRKTDDGEHVPALQAGFAVKDPRGGLERLKAVLGRACLRGEEGVPGARRYGAAVHEERQHRETGVAAFDC